MKVYKFGGASVNSIERIQQTAAILKAHTQQKILIVISAMGKTTNALEKVADAFCAGNQQQALQLFEVIKQQHLTTAKYLLVKNYNATYNQLINFFTEAEWLLHDTPVREFDYYYDQIVCIGELLSTCIVSAYWNEVGITNTWIDVRDIFRTDNNFKEANVDWNTTQDKTDKYIKPLFNETNIVVTQGFIGATDENESTTLGREGSDYSAAIFANMLDAESQTIWKDVEGIMNADPKQFAAAQLIPELNYNEVIEMAYYGAQVIHPKTIKPLQNKDIPLLVKCFLNADLPGTVIHHQHIKKLPPIIVWKQDQVLMQLNSKDFSFVGERPIGMLYHMFEAHNIRPNLSQNGAISFVCCLDNREEKLQQLALEAAEMFDVQIKKGLTLLTIRHYTEALLQSLTANKKIVLTQKSTDTVQVLMVAE
jgi:aspartate kinase